MLRLLVPSATTCRAPRAGPPSSQPSRSENSKTTAIASHALQPRFKIEPNSVTVTNASDAAPVASEITSTGRSSRRARLGTRCRTSTPAASGRVMVAASIARLVNILNRKSSVSASTRMATWAASGVRSTEASGNPAVKPAASARSARARRAKTGTTGANGDAASRTMATAMSRFRPNPRAAAMVSAGTTAKLTNKIAANRQRISAAFTSSQVSRKPTAPSSPTSALQVRILTVVSMPVMVA